MSETATPANTPAPTPTGEAPKPEGQPVPKETPKPKQFIDIDGERVDLDEIKRDRKKYKGADDKFREAAQARKEVDQFYARLMENPEEILNDPRIPLKKRELAEKWLTEHLQEELRTVDPKDKEAEELRQKLKKYEDQEAEQKTKAEQEQYQKVVEKRREEIATTLSKAMELSPLAKDPEVAAATLKEMVSYLRMTRAAGYNATPEEIAQHIEGQKLSSFRTLANRLEGDELVSFLGESVVKKLIAAHLGKIQKARSVPAPEVAQDWQPRDQKSKREWQDPDELRRRK